MKELILIFMKKEHLGIKPTHLMHVSESIASDLSSEQG